MIAFPMTLTPAAVKSGMKTPDLSGEFEQWDPDEYPHFTVFYHLQLGRPTVVCGPHWENAKIIASIPDEKIRSVRIEEILEMGWIC